MRSIDILIAGGGLAGSTAAAMLARDGHDVALVDPHPVYPPDLRCEKLDGRQVELLRRTGLADPVLAAGTFDGECWVARFGRVVERRPGDQYGLLYDTLVNTVRAAIPAQVPFITGTVSAIAGVGDRQLVTLSNGDVLCVRLVVIASGLNTGLRRGLGMVRDNVSRCHCVTFAFDLQPLGRGQFPFGALTYYGERTADRVAYLTLFPVGSSMHANLMVYRRPDDPWLLEMRRQPERTLSWTMPRLGRVLGRFEVVGPVKARPADLYMTRNFLQPGIVLVGDAFATSCPAAGTGANKVFTDVERLCHAHVPRWLASRGMGVEKIAAFYADPAKLACDRHSWDKAFKLRSDSIEDGLPWRARRWVRFLGRLTIGAGRRALPGVNSRAPRGEAQA